MRFTFSFTLAVMVAVAVIISITSSAPIAVNTNNNSGDLTLRADFHPDQLQPIKKRDDHDYDNIVNNNNDKESEIAYKYPIGDFCIMKPSDGSDDGSHTSDKNGPFPAAWCPPQTHYPEPHYWK